MQKRRYVILIVLLGIVILWGRTCRTDKAITEDAQILKRTGKAFTEVAKRAIPAVVFVRVERTIEVPGRTFNDPYGLFGDEMLERFFGRQGGTAPAPRRFKQPGQGSGFLISDDGYILTNNHVVGDADKITVKLNDGREFDAKRIGADPKTEVAVIKIEGKNLPYLEMGDSSALEIGEWVIAIGNPFGLVETLTVGVVSAKGRSNIGIADYEDFIQTDAAINPGNSGGPLLNIEGKVIGINTAIFSRDRGYMGIGFAIPSDMAIAIKDQLIKTGKVVRGFLGVELNRAEVDETVAAHFGLKKAGGILVVRVIKDSPAEKAGLQAEDIVLKIGGEKVLNNSSFRNAIAGISPGTKVKLRVFRDKKEKTISVTIGTLPEDVAMNVQPKTLKSVEKLGLAVEDLTADIARQLGYEISEGVVVTGVEPGGVVAEAGIQPGFLILSVDGTPVNNIQEFHTAITAAVEKGRVVLQIRHQSYVGFVPLRIQ